MNLVIVADSPAERRLCQVLLAKVYGSAQGLQVCSQEAPDCVLLDYRLHYMKGLEFLAALWNSLLQESLPPPLSCSQVWQAGRWPWKP